MNSIRQRLIVFFVIIATAVLGLSGTYSYWRSRNELEQDLQQTGEALKKRLQTSLPAPVWNFDTNQIDQILDSEIQSPKVQQIVITQNDELIAGRTTTATGQTVRLDAIPPRAPDTIEFNIFIHNDNLLPIAKGAILLSDAPMNEQLRLRVQERVIEIAILVAIIVLALSRSLSSLLGRPLQQLQDRLQCTADQTDEGVADEALLLPDCQYVEFSGVTNGYNRIARRLLQDLRKRREAEDEMREAKEAAESAYRKLKDTQDTLVQAEKMASLGGLVAGIAHEINTPVGVILTSASVLREDTEVFHKNIEAGVVKKSEVMRYTETAVQSASLIQANAERAAALIQGFKQVAVDQTSEARRTFELGHYLEEVILSLRPAYKHSPITMEIDCPEKIEMDSYPGALSQIITNMVTNSLHHAFEPDQPGKMHIAATSKNNSVEILFSDNGCGILPEHIGHVFDPFFTTKRGAGGSGLGLNIVYNLVTQTLGGTIELDSSPGKGTTFTISLPRIATAPKD